MGGFVLCALLLAAGCGGGGGGNGVLGGSNNGGSTGTVATGIRGRVVDSVSRQPIADAAVTVGNRSARTGADGKFALSTGVGTVSIQASAKDYNPSTFSSVVEQNQTTDVGDLPLASSEDNPPPPPI